jgi:hypothetical protein
MSLLQGLKAAYLLAPRQQVQPKENSVMLKEFGQIARGMMFLHGHFTHADDAAETKPVKAQPTVRKPVGKGSRGGRGKHALIALTAGLPMRISLIQIR